MKKMFLGLLVSASLLAGSASCFASESAKELALERNYSYPGMKPFVVKVWVQNDLKGTITYTGESYTDGKLDYRATNISKYTIYPETDWRGTGN